MLPSRLSQTLRAAALAGCTIVTIVACSSNNGEEQDICQTTVTGTSSPTTGALTLTGQFYANETVILQYSDGNQTRSATGTPATDRSAFTLTGLPSGEKTYTLIISCAGGQENNGSHSYTVK
ncbi:MAG: hypothetical protein ABJC26_17570 [Gemmatimonadaceae bacterium]